jgi:stearoyl-CoA desaturase (delta-9 desaturase)
MHDDDFVQLPSPTLTTQIVTCVAVIVPFLGLVAAIVSLWGWAVGWPELSLLVGMYLATGLGVTLGFHRYFAHRSFETVRPIKFVLGVLGSMSMQGPILRWVAVHRRHHQHSDTEEDPHSPHGHGGGVRGVLVGFWHAHIGWMFDDKPLRLGRYVRDFRSDRLMATLNRLFGVWVFLGLLVPTAVGGLLTGTWTGALLGFLWGGLARIFLVHHATWSINSVCHIWGRQPFKARDESRNNFIFGVIGLGEGWHNNHHAFPASARHGLRWWEIDFSYLVLQLLRLLRLAWNVRLPTSQALKTLQRSASPA